MPPTTQQQQPQPPPPPQQQQQQQQKQQQQHQQQQRSNQLRVKVNEVAPSLLQPSPILGGTRTPMHLVHISNRKLNQEVFSNQDRSIHRRIVIKNFLTELYQLHPIEWIEPSSVAVDDQDQWLEQTLSAAGIDSQDEDGVDADNDHNDDYYTDSHHHHHDSQDLAELSPSAAAAASVVASRRRPLSLRSNRVPLPRPVSVELSQSLHSYLSAVFDVNWSIGQSSNTEDSFVTAPTSNHPLSSSSSSSSSASASGSSSRSQALSTKRPTLGQRTIESFMAPEQDNATTGQGKKSYGRGTDINYKADESHQLQQQHQGGSRPDTASVSHHQQRHQGSNKNNSKVVSASRVGPESRTPPPRPSTPPPLLASKNALTTTTATKTSEKYAPPRPERPSSPSAMPYTLCFDPDPSLSMQQSNYAASTAVYEPISMAPQQHIHNHIHIHVHNYPPEATTAATTTTTLSTSPPRRSITPPPRSSRYPKPPPPRPTTTTTTTTTTEYISYSTDYSTSIHPQWTTTDPKAILSATAAATANLPPTWQPVSLESLLPSTMTTTSTASYPPEKSADGLMNGRDVEEEDEQPYLATSPPTTSRYPRSPPPPPYTQSPIDQNSFAAPLSPSMSPAAFSPYEAYASKQQQSTFMPVLTTQPQSTLASDASASANQKLLEYKQYQERQKMFARGDDSEKDESLKLDGLGFIRRLSRQSSKKKNPLASISAPLPSTLSYSSSSASSTTSLSVAVPLYTIGGGLERYHDDQQQQSSSSKGVDVSGGGSARYSLQPAAKNAVSMLKGTLSSVKSGLSRSSSPTPSSASSIGPIGPPMTMSSSALSYGAVDRVSCVGPQQMYHYPAPSTSASPSSATMTTVVL
ncbi:hypothetical protein BG015_010452 [Linnemannia schmuckeri]|uniref:Uncharacterized protein n=1 Tax=Linnemannia schmuckeri TaxID=64567 RepID=A0A9P5RXJ2_9FUNG|nr:hypothetical protein BG015_010452 [Linnemannia schmuckeri]